MNYKETTVTGSSWVRANSVTVHNPLGGTGAIRFNEERVIVLEDKTISEPVGSVQDRLTEDKRSKVFDLKHPETLEVVGQATYEQVYLLLHSLYLHLAAERDYSQSAEEVEEGEGESEPDSF